MFIKRATIEILRKAFKSKGADEAAHLAKGMKNLKPDETIGFIDAGLEGVTKMVTGPKPGTVQVAKKFDHNSPLVTRRALSNKYKAIQKAHKEAPEVVNRVNKIKAGKNEPTVFYSDYIAKPKGKHTESSKYRKSLQKKLDYPIDKNNIVDVRATEGITPPKRQLLLESDNSKAKKYNLRKLNEESDWINESLGRHNVIGNKMIDPIVVDGKGFAETDRLLRLSKKKILNNLSDREAKELVAINKTKKHNGLGYDLLGIKGIDKTRNLLKGDSIAQGSENFGEFRKAKNKKIDNVVKARKGPDGYPLTKSQRAEVIEKEIDRAGIPSPKVIRMPTLNKPVKKSVPKKKAKPKQPSTQDLYSAGDLGLEAGLGTDFRFSLGTTLREEMQRV